MKSTQMLWSSTLALAITLSGGVWVNQNVNAASADTNQVKTQKLGAERGNHGGFRGGCVNNSEALAKLLGVTTDELQASLKSGKSLADLATAKGVTVQSVIDLQVTEMTAKLDEQLAAGKVTQEEYNTRKATLTDHATKMVNGEQMEEHLDGKGRHGGFGGGFMKNSEGLATLLGVTTDELQASLKSGKSLADLATAKGVTVQSVIDLQVTEMTAKLDEQLAAGKVTQEEYNTRKATLTDHVTKMVNGEQTVGDKGNHHGLGGERNSHSVHSKDATRTTK